MSNELSQYFHGEVQRILADLQTECPPDAMQFVRSACDQLESSLAKYLTRFEFLNKAKILVANGSGQRVVQYDSEHPTGFERYQDRNVIAAVAYARINGSLKILAGTIRGVTVIDEETGEVEREYKHKTMSQVGSVQYEVVNGEPCIFATGFGGEGIYLFRLNAPDNPVCIPGTKPLGTAMGVAKRIGIEWHLFTSDAFTSEGVVYDFLIDAKHPEKITLVRTFEGSGRNISSIAVVNDKVYAGSDFVRRWSIYSPKEPEVTFKGSDDAITALEVAEVNGRAMVFAGTHNRHGFNKVFAWYDESPEAPFNEFEKGLDGTGALKYASIAGGHYIVVGSANQLGYKTRDGDVCVFDIDSGLVSKLPGLRGVNVNGISTVSGIRDIALLPTG